MAIKMQRRNVVLFCDAMLAAFWAAAFCQFQVSIASAGASIGDFGDMPLEHLNMIVFYLLLTFPFFLLTVVKTAYLIKLLLCILIVFLFSLGLLMVARIKISTSRMREVRWHVACATASAFIGSVLLWYVTAISHHNPEGWEGVLGAQRLPFSIFTLPLLYGIRNILGPIFAIPYALAWGYGLMYLGRWIWRRFLRGRFSRGGAGAAPEAATASGPREDPSGDGG